MNSKNDKIDNDGWEPCPEGLISDSVAERNEVSHNRRMFFFKSAMGAVLGAAGIRAYIHSRDLRPNNYENFISCYEVTANLDKFVDDTLNDKNLFRKINLHLAVCNYCSDAHENIVNSRNPVTNKSELKTLLAHNRQA